jgi:hypothetical protein
MKCHSCQKEINPIERIKGNFVCHDNKGNELDNTIYREFGVVICKVEVKFPPQLFCHTTCYILHKNQVSFADKMEKKEVIINCQHCQERIKGRAIEKFLEEKKSKELNKFLVYLHDNKKC